MKIPSLSGKVIYSKNEELYLDFLMLNDKKCDYNIWKINILHEDCFIKFIVKNDVSFKSPFLLL